jgi:hypothetical protein
VRGLLAATLIVKNEARVLDACLASLRGVVDEIVAVDTGSTDESIEIARRHGALVHEHPWSGDFAEARNEALRLASCEWIFYIDADERLDPAERASVEKLLRDAPEVAFRILLKPDSRSTPYREYRVWRHDPRIRFEGVIHEKVVPAIQRVSEEDGRPIGVGISSSRTLATRATRRTSIAATSRSCGASSRSSQTTSSTSTISHAFWKDSASRRRPRRCWHARSSS